jgi:phosphoglycerate kinase
VDERVFDDARAALQAARAAGTQIVLPVDAQIVRDGERAVAPATAIPEGWQGWDIGPQTIELFRNHIQSAKTIVWAGPLGRFEDPPYDEGTRAIAQAIAQSHAFAIIGGGDTAAALHRWGLGQAQNIYCSTGGGATLEFIAGRTLPPIEILKA